MILYPVLSTVIEDRLSLCLSSTYCLSVSRMSIWCTRRLLDYSRLCVPPFPDFRDRRSPLDHLTSASIDLAEITLFLFILLTSEHHCGIMFLDRKGFLKPTGFKVPYLRVPGSTDQIKVPSCCTLVVQIYGISWQEDSTVVQCNTEDKWAS